jgi:hypothetical protein
MRILTKIEAKHVSGARNGASNTNPGNSKLGSKNAGGGPGNSGPGDKNSAGLGGGGVGSR